MGLVMKCASLRTKINIAGRLEIVNPWPYLILKDTEIKDLSIIEISIWVLKFEPD